MGLVVKARGRDMHLRNAGCEGLWGNGICRGWGAMGKLPNLRNSMGLLGIGGVVREICTGGRPEEKAGERKRYPDIHRAYIIILISFIFSSERRRGRG